MADASGGLVAALKASIANPDHGWVVTAATQDPADVPTAVTVAMMAPALRIAVGSRVPMQMAYCAKIAAGALTAEGAKLILAGAQLRTTDAALHTAVMAKVAAFLAAKDTALTAALVAGPP